MPTEEEQGILSLQQRLKWLSGIIENEQLSVSDRLRALEQMNKMQTEARHQEVVKLEDLL